MNNLLTNALLFMMMTYTPLPFAENTLGQFAQHQDIGAVKHPGSVTFDKALQTYQIAGSGKNMWGSEDQFHFAWNKIEGDFIVRARMDFVAEGVDPHRKIGWNVRQNLDPGSPHVHATMHGDGLTSLQFREKQDGNTEQYLLNITNTNVIQLERRGDTYIMSAAKHGQPFSVTQVSHVELGKSVYVGLAMCSHNPDVIETAVFSNVRIIIPAKKGFRPYQDYIGSNLEIMDMETHTRRIIYRDPDSIQAPNWTLDGEKLIYNSKGLLYNYTLANNEISVLNTGFAKENNNDHVLSWNGQDIAISHHNADDNHHSTIYTLPLTGSDKPTQITRTGAGHSFLHGYSPDDKDLIFTAERKNKWDIYKVNIASGMETQLTDTATLDDGSEYGPDGKYIYFNSNRTGTMQLWRINADGSHPLQLTFDQYNDWFPHISPDGKKIVFLSYMEDVDSGDHPFYRHVYLREIPAEGGDAKIIAYIYGGQGTMNVPSWSPDGKYIAFVSNTQL